MIMRTTRLEAARIIGTIASLIALAACGSEVPKHVITPVDEVAAFDDAASDHAASGHAGRHVQSRTLPSELPTECSSGDRDCLPPSAWVSKLCNGVHPEVALHMFRGGSPWLRLYARATAPAYNGAGGPSLSDERVNRGEELIALRRNTDARDSSAGEMSVGDTAGYDLLRWNGSCVTLHDGEYSTKRPRRSNYARIEWKWLGDEVQSALRNDDDVGRAFLARRKECQGATLGRVTKKCVEQDNSFVAAIVGYVRAGGELPAPSEHL